jgi:transposase
VTTIEELWEKYRQEMDGLIRERLLMVIWMKEGISSYEAGNRLKCPHSKVLYWKYRFDKEGVSGLKTRLRSGKPSKLAKDEKKRIKQILEAENWWKTKWVSDLIYKETGVVYSQRHVVRLLHAWGFEKIRPRKEHAEADDRERKEFSKKTETYWAICPKAGI